ncbi:MAG: NAD(+) diphosphatase [Treponema sp.]|jgi:NAD+ diphosphatase|nr:NAD(+) diphosphatase [Treponema sp.]
METSLPEGRASRIFVFYGDALAVPTSLLNGISHEIGGFSLFKGFGREQLPEEWTERAADYFEIHETWGECSIAGLLLDAAVSLPEGWQTVNIRHYLPFAEQCVFSPGREDIARLFRACHVMHWRKESAYCGVCGSRNTDAPDELARLCPICGRREYPRISPAVIVLVTNDRDEVLLAHNKKFSDGVYSLIAGFNEAGENLETTAEREVLEEAGIGIDCLRYEASQPWPFPNSLMIGFTARHSCGEIRPDGEEIDDARWFRRDFLPDLPSPGSMARYLINRWLYGASPCAKQ